MKIYLNIILFLLLPLFASADGLSIKDNYSPKNSKCKVRSQTSYIVLHTTESSDGSAINSVKKGALANYLVLTNGSVQRIVSKNRIANHAGRSMWNGRESISKYSVGIEIVGYHNIKPSRKQLASLKELISQLQEIYGLTDENVLTHSMVAYGEPNPYHARKQRGRKRCGMFFAQSDVRKKMGLDNVFTQDPDVSADRLIVGDKDLFKILYSKTKPAQDVAYSELRLEKKKNKITKKNTAWDIAREKYNYRSTVYNFPNGDRYQGDMIPNWGTVPVGTIISFDTNIPVSVREKVGLFTINNTQSSAWSVAGVNYNKASTIYFLKNGTIRSGDQLDKDVLDNLVIGTKVLVGYIYGGHVSLQRTAYSIAGANWDSPDTLYYLPDGILVEGDDVIQSKITQGTLVLFKK